MLAGRQRSVVKVLVTDPIAEPGLAQLREAGHTVETRYDVDGGEDLRDVIGDVHALIVRSGTEVDRSVLEAGSELVIVARAGIGVDNIDIDAATEQGIVVANAPEGNVLAAAEHTVGMVFATVRSIPQAHSRLRSGEWAKDEYLGFKLAGRTLGVIGLGRVGQEVARRFDALGMDVIAFDPYISDERAQQIGAELGDLDTVLDLADVLTIHTPLTDETAGLIGDAELAQLDGGYLVNCARGGIVDEAALAAAVADGTLAGAAVDVFTTEPVEPDNPLLQTENVVVTPHLGASTVAAQETVAVDAAEQVLAAFEERPVPNALNVPSIESSAFQRIAPYVELAETAGKVATQLLDERIENVEVRYEGAVAEEDVEYVTAWALKGVFAPIEWQVNAVNAPRIAEERGVEVIETKTRESDEFQSLITVTVGNGDAALSVSGTLFAEDDGRIVRVDGFRVDAIPHGRMVVTRNDDVPGVIGLIGSVMGEHDVNIAGMYNAREKVGGVALTVYNVDDPVPQQAIDTLLEDDRIDDLRVIELASGR
jgi:D-3-phosphoglycerate dehydrogenase